MRSGIVPQRPGRCVVGLALVLAIAIAPTADARGRRRPAKARTTGGKAKAQPRRAGTVLAIRSGELVIDLGRSDGLDAATKLRLYRTVKARHPVTRKVLLDRFPIGVVTVDEVADKLCLLRPDKPLLLQLAVGDRVEVVRPRPASKPSPTASPVVRPRKCPPSRVVRIDPQRPPWRREIERVFGATLGLQPAERVALWRRYLRMYPGNPAAQAVQAEIDTMSELGHATALGRADAKRRADLEALSRRVHWTAPRKAHRGQPVWIVLSAASWAAVSDVRIYVRNVGEGTYTLARPLPSGALHRRFRVPDERVRPPGLEYFIEINDPAGNLHRPAGTPSNPRSVAIDDPFTDITSERKGASSVRWVTEYVDFNRMRGDDTVLTAELDVSYRVQRGRLYAFSLGYGFLNGRGGSVASDSPTASDGSPLRHADGSLVQKGDTIDPREASFKYAWLATEWALSDGFHLLTKLAVGLDPEGLDLGLEVAARIGQERGTNLNLGVSTLGDMGRLASVALTTHVVDRLPMSGIFQVTSQPVRKDLGIRLIYQVDYELTDAVVLTGRLGYNLRTIVHAGASFGGGMAFHW